MLKQKWVFIDDVRKGVVRTWILKHDARIQKGRIKRTNVVSSIVYKAIKSENFKADVTNNPSPTVDVVQIHRTSAHND